MSFCRIRSCCFSRVVRDGLFGKFEVEFDGQINTFPVRIEVLWTDYNAPEAKQILTLHAVGIFIRR